MSRLVLAALIFGALLVFCAAGAWIAICLCQRRRRCSLYQEKRSKAWLEMVERGSKRHEEARAMRHANGEITPAPQVIANDRSGETKPTNTRRRT